MLGVGDEVMCIDDSKPSAFNPLDYPNWVKKGTEYTVRELLDNDNIVVGVLLEELVNPTVYIKLIDRFQENTFGTFRFALQKTAYAIEKEKEFEAITKKILEEMLQ